MLTPTASAVLLGVPTATPPLPSPPLIEPPLLVAVPVLLPKLALSTSVNTPAGATLATVNVWLTPPPTRWFASVTGVGVVLPTARL